VTELQQQLQQLQEELSKSQENEKQHSAKIQELTQSVSTLQLQNNTLSSTVQSQKDEINKLHDQIKQEKHTHTDAIKKHASDYSQLETNYQLTVKELETARNTTKTDDSNKLKELQDKLQKASLDNLSSVMTIENLLSTEKQLNEEISTLNYNAKMSADEIAFLKKQLQETECSNIALNKKVADLQTSLIKSDSDKILIQKQVQQATQAPSQDIVNLEQQLKLEKQQREELEKKLGQKQQDFLLQTIRKSTQTQAISDRAHNAPQPSFTFSAFALTALQTIANTK
jgi:chromosome segregation ATPase